MPVSMRPRRGSRRWRGPDATGSRMALECASVEKRVRRSCGGLVLPEAQARPEL